MWGHWKDVESEYESKVKDPWDWVTHFENAVARYTGAKHAIACDSNTNAIRLLLHRFGFDKPEYTIQIPNRTYVSVANQIILSGCTPVFKDKQWYKHYMLGGTPITDAAVSFYEGMFTKINKHPMHNFPDENVVVLSFHHRKILNIGTGGMILTNSDMLNDWLRPMIYDGRTKYMKYDEDVFSCVGWHMYMTPEQAKRGLEIMHSDRIDSTNTQYEQSYKDYKPLRNQPIFRKYQLNPIEVEFNFNNDVILNWMNIVNTNRKVEDYLFNLEFLDTAEHKSKLINNEPFPISEFQSTFNDLDINSFPEDVDFILFDHIECFSNYDSSPLILWIYNFFKELGMSHRFKIYGNNLDYKSNILNYEPVPFFMGDSSYQSEKELLNKNIDKHFISAQGAPKLVRIKLQNFLNKNNLLEKSYWSWNPNGAYIGPNSIKRYPHLKITKGLSDVENVGNSDSLSVAKMHTITPEWRKSFCAIVSETFFYAASYDFFNPRVKPTFITEKTEKCFTAGIPFIMFATTGFLKKLKELGFKTFGKWWDESYDEIEDDNDRFWAVCDIITEISTWDIKKCKKIQNEMIDILKHNQNNNIKLNLYNKKLKRTRDEYLNSIRTKPIEKRLRSII